MTGVLQEWRKWTKQAFARRKKDAAPRQAAVRWRPSLEMLEDRYVLSVSFTQQSMPMTGSGPIAVASGDFNGEGKTDLVTADFAANGVTVLLGNGNETFSTGVFYSAGSGPFGVD